MLNKNKTKLFVIAIAAIVLVFSVYFIINLTQNQPVIGPYIPSEGEEKDLQVLVTFKNQTFADQINITMRDVKTGEVFTKICNKDLRVELRSVVGSEYLMP